MADEERRPSYSYDEDCYLPEGPPGVKYWWCFTELERLMGAFKFGAIIETTAGDDGKFP